MLPTLNREFLASGQVKIAAGPAGRLPERILQFGEGNFLRAFVDWMVNEMNRKGLFNGSVVVVQPIEQGLADLVNAQDGCYTVLLRGMQGGQVVDRREVVTAISRALNPYRQWDDYLACARNPDLRFVVSNTTEAGIAYKPEPRPQGACPESFPAKLAALLLARFEAFAGAKSAGLAVIPCELIENNGRTLKEVVLRLAREWQAGAAFEAWVDEACVFCNTLVDRIVPGYPKDEAARLCAELGYEDKLLDAGEIFHLWVIEGPQALAKELPLAEAGLDVVWTDNQKPYRDRKVAVLNGAHTASVLAAFHCGLDTVGEMMQDADAGRFVRRFIDTEVVPTVDLPEAEKRAFAAAVVERFQNPFVRHELLSISLNSVSKWKVRVLPTLKRNVARNGVVPALAAFSLAALVNFYDGQLGADGRMAGTRQGKDYPINDNREILEFFAAQAGKSSAAVAEAVLKKSEFWGEDLTNHPGMLAAVATQLEAIRSQGMRPALQALLR